MLTVRESIQKLNPDVDPASVEVYDCLPMPSWDRTQKLNAKLGKGDYVCLFQGKELTDRQREHYKYNSEQWYFWIDDYYGALNDPQVNWHMTMDGETLIRTYL